MRTRKIADALKILILASLAVIFIHHFILQPVFIRDNTMAPDYLEGDIIIVNRLWNWNKNIEREQVVMLRRYDDNPYKTLRRVIGFPGERVKISDGIISIDGKERSQSEIPLYGTTVSSITDIGAIDKGEFFVVTNTELKMPVGIIDERKIVGVPLFRLWPLIR